MIKTKFVIFSEKRFTATDKIAIMKAIEDLYEDINIEEKESYIEEKVDI